jgi:hypothetical protein
MIRENFYNANQILTFFDLFEKKNHSKSLDQVFAHCPIFITAILKEFSFCFRANQAKKSLNYAKDCRSKKFKLLCKS